MKLYTPSFQPYRNIYFANQQQLYKQNPDNVVLQLQESWADSRRFGVFVDCLQDHQVLDETSAGLFRQEALKSYNEQLQLIKFYRTHFLPQILKRHKIEIVGLSGKHPIYKLKMAHLRNIHILNALNQVGAVAIAIPDFKQASNVDLESLLDFKGHFKLATAFSTLCQRLRFLDLSLQYGGEPLQLKTMEQFSRWPLDQLNELRLNSIGLTPEGLKYLAQSNRLPNLTSLDLSDNPLLSIGGGEALRLNTSWKNLKTLLLNFCGLDNEDAVELGLITAWPKLSLLALRNNQLSDDGLIGLAQNRNWHDLSSLSLSYNQAGSAGVRALVQNPTWQNLENLELDSNAIGADGVESLALSPFLGNLHKLSLDDNPLQDVGAEALSKNRIWHKLHTLGLGDCEIGDVGVAALARNPHWNNLSYINFHNNFVGSEGAIALGNNQSWINLSRLILDHNDIHDRGIKGLAKNTSWKRLQELGLENCSITNRGLLHLAKNRSWESLNTLNVSDNPLLPAETVDILILAARWLWKKMFYSEGKQKIRERWPSILILNYQTSHLPLI